MTVRNKNQITPALKTLNEASCRLDLVDSSSVPPEVEVVIEIPRGSFLKRGSTGHVDFVSPLPCPFNYGSVPVDPEW